MMTYSDSESQNFLAFKEKGISKVGQVRQELKISLDKGIGPRSSFLSPPSANSQIKREQGLGTPFTSGRVIGLLSGLHTGLKKNSKESSKLSSPLVSPDPPEATVQFSLMESPLKFR